MEDNILISVFKKTVDKQPQAVTLKAILEKIGSSLALKNLSDKLQTITDKKERQLFKQKNLPAITVSGTFKNGHSASDLINHSNLLQIDIDNLDTQGLKSMSELKKLLQKDPYTFVLFVSVSGSGLKIFVRIDGIKHVESFKALMIYYREKYYLDIDPKCGDLGRLCFLNYDPDIWINKAAQRFVVESSTLEPLNRPALSQLNNDQTTNIELFTQQIEGLKIDITGGYSNWLKLGFALANELGEQGRQYFHRLSCLSSQYLVAETDKQFSSCLKSKKKGISIKTFFKLAQENGVLINSVLKNKRNSTSINEYSDPKNSKNNENKNLPLITRVENFLNEHFEFRRNVINEKLEYRKKNESIISWSQVSENVISRFLQKNYFNYSPNKTADLLNSDFVNEYNPFVEYFENLPAWNKNNEPSYIDKLTSLIKAKDQERLTIQFRKMLIRCVACATVRGNTNPNFNKHVFVLVNPNQSTGKSTLCRWLCPPQLQDYFLENISFDKDGNIALAQGFLINLDELASLSKYDSNLLKTFISKASINERLPYGKSRKFYPRRANFIGSTNNIEFLIDETGNVRWLCFEIEHINFGYSDPDSEYFVDINRLWAEAYSSFKDGDEWQLTTQERLENESSNKTFQLISEEEELIISNFESVEKQKQFFATNTDILQKLAFKGLNTSRLSPKKLGAVLRKLNFTRGEERLGKYPIKGYYLKEIIR